MQHIEEAKPNLPAQEAALTPTPIDYAAAARLAESARLDRRRLNAIDEAFAVVARGLRVPVDTIRDNLVVLNVHVGRGSTLTDSVILRRSGGLRRVQVAHGKTYRHSRLLGCGSELSTTALAKTLAH